MILYIRSGQLQQSVAEKFRFVMTYRDSIDRKIREAVSSTISGWKWAAITSATLVKGALKLKESKCRKARAGDCPLPAMGKVNPKEWRAIVYAEVRKLEEEVILKVPVQEED